MRAWAPALTNWYRQHCRQLAWRSDPIPYKVWISEMMLQQTQIDTVVPYFDRFMAKFPSIQALAEADQQDVLKCWEGLGYYSRARNLHKAAKCLVEDHNGQFPETYEGLQKLPGIGPYSAAAIISIAFNQPVPVVDGNVLRVCTRLWGIDEDIRLPKVRDAIFEKLSPEIKTVNPSEFNQGIMELGALICRPSSPKCEACPIQSHCKAYADNRVSELPYKSKAKPSPHYNIAVGVIWKDDKVLIGKRQENQMLGGLWEFPGGKQEKGESLENTVKREVLEETGLNVQVENCYCVVKHAYTHFKITMHAYKCIYIDGQLEAKSSSELKWVSLDELDEYPFPKANKRVIETLKSPQLQIF